MLMIWICHFIKYHFELVDHKGSSDCVCSSRLYMHLPYVGTRALITASGNYCRHTLQSISIPFLSLGLGIELCVL